MQLIHMTELTQYNILIQLLVLGLAIYRLSTIVAVDTITDPIREYAITKASTGSRLWQFAAGVVDCAYCAGVYIGFILYPLSYTLYGSYFIFVLATLGVQNLFLSFENRQ